jgi:hypothetical protein
LKGEDMWVDKKIIRLSKTAEKLLGWSGKMLYTSRSMKKPTTIFNANIFNSKAKKIWFGDLEIERDAEAILKLSRRLGPLYILYEMGGRFLEEIPAVGFIRSRAIVIVEGGQISYSAGFAERVEILGKKMKKRRCESLRVLSSGITLSSLFRNYAAKIDMFIKGDM